MSDDGSTQTRRLVFVSYAHEDERWRDELLVHLKPWMPDRRIEVWSDRDIAPGAAWRPEIERALDEAAVAVMIVTPSLLASNFVMDEELPTILRRAEDGSVRLIWIAAEPSGYEATALAGLQAVNDPARPLSTLTKPDRQAALSDIAKSIATSTTLDTLASSLSIVDETYEPLEAMTEGRAEVPNRTFGVVAEYQSGPQEITFSSTSLTRITQDDLSGLPPEDHEFIQDLEESLRKNYTRWREVRKGVGDAGGALDEEIDRQLHRIASNMCTDLNLILGFLIQIHRADLEDHYGRYRFLCSQLASS